MAFLRRKKIKGRWYLYRVESYRNSEGEPRQRVLKYKGAVDPIFKPRFRRRKKRRGAKVVRRKPAAKRRPPKRSLSKRRKR